MPHAYLNFDLLIETSPKGYRARVVDSPTGEAVEEIALSSFSFTEDAQAVGTWLYQTIFINNIDNCFVVSWDRAKQKENGLRIRIRVDKQSADVAALPWEKLYWPDQMRFLALSSDSPIVRYIELPDKPPPLKIEFPLTILVVMSAPIDLYHLNLPALDVEHEIQLIRKATEELEAKGLITIERLMHPTPADLQDRLRKGTVHVLHYVGHGYFDEMKKQGGLYLENGEGKGQRVDAATLAVLLREKPPQLIFLNTCQGASSSTQDLFTGVAQRLVQQGVPAVIAMQQPISDSSAITLAHTFYKAVADEYPVDAALAEARKALFAESQSEEWAVPSLFMRSPDGVLFRRIDNNTPSMYKTRLVLSCSFAASVAILLFASFLYNWFDWRSNLLGTEPTKTIAISNETETARPSALATAVLLVVTSTATSDVTAISTATSETVPSPTLSQYDKCLEEIQEQSSYLCIADQEWNNISIQARWQLFGITHDYGWIVVQLPGQESPDSPIVARLRIEKDQQGSGDVWVNPESETAKQIASQKGKRLRLIARLYEDDGDGSLRLIGGKLGGKDRQVNVIAVFNVSVPE